jgi:hypothetical protein
VIGERGFDRQYLSVAELNPQVPDELSDLIHDCMRYDPARRPASMADVREQLAELGE